LRPFLAELRERARETSPRSLSLSLAEPAHLALIAELKRASPSHGTINTRMDLPTRAQAYVAAGARALSVLTEPNEFGARPNDFPDVAARVSVPVLQKDFHVGRAQIWEARARGAAAMLFIARALAPSELEDLVAAAIEAGVEPLVEVRTEEELARALRTSASMIGVNARDLETLIVDFEATERLLPRIPRDRVAIAESGIQSRGDVERVAALGADAILVGSALSRAADATLAVSQLVGVPRRQRGH
jgi:indole-3-glycerol phosphate synthase